MIIFANLSGGLKKHIRSLFTFGFTICRNTTSNEAYTNSLDWRAELVVYAINRILATKSIDNAPQVD